ncbi:hypothetical protein BS47DRAFT_1374038 [Hydnum rufescens UP504]|uniref:Apyrase n=1 Tax=Hydnum rufescens UP504 TaxID=1448309 RepID=A0A9P6DME2_9AGAM|nr:hypothetical protein BS47DRAFT_1374038 [Hydnum rufescens UP504]
MPPPLSDPWLASRRFGLVIDAGSSGSRLQIYSWKDARDLRRHTNENDPILEALPRVEKGTQLPDGWLRKVEPGISSFAREPASVGAYLSPLLMHAMETIPPSLHSETPIFLLATAGMRLLSPTQQTRIIEATCSYIRLNSAFRLDKASDQGPCGSSVRIITGEEEGLYGWIAVNYLMDGFAGHEDNHRATYGFLDMGGASTQIAFEPSASERERMSPSAKDTLVEVRLRLLGGEEIRHQVFVTTWLGYGTNQARERYVALEMKEWGAHSSFAAEKPIPDPCLPRDLELSEAPANWDAAHDSHMRTAHTFLGTGSFPDCLARTAPLLNKAVPCPDTSCLLNGVPAPAIDFSLSKFIGVSEYWYSSEHVFGLGGAYDFVQYERAATEFCSHTESREGVTGSKGKWGTVVGIGRLRMQCFKAAWIVNVLHEGIGMPRIVDSGGNTTTNEVDSAAQKATDKGLGATAGPPTFQSVDTIGDTAISWTLGKMVLEASKEVPPLSSSIPPLLDPAIPHHGTSWSVPLDPPLGDHIKHIQSQLFSPAVVPVYLLFSLVSAYVLYRLRRRIRGSSSRRRRRRDGEPAALFDYFSMEESGGNISSSSSSPPVSPGPSGKSETRLIRSFRWIFRAWSPPRLRSVERPSLRRTRTSPAMFTTPPTPNSSWNASQVPPVSSIRSPSSIIIPNGYNHNIRISGSRPPSLRSPSKPPSEYESEGGSNGDDEHELEYDYSYDSESSGRNLSVPTSRQYQSKSSSPLAFPSPYGNRSRNSSQVNLTSAVPRTTSVSRLGFTSNLHHGT